MEKCLNTTLSTLAGGAAEELFQQALLAVLENIVDPNMDAKKKRTIEIQFTFLPDGKRGGVAVGVEIKKVGLAAPGGATTRFDLVSPARVDLLGPLQNYHRGRETVLSAVYPVNGAATLEKWTELDQGRIVREELLSALQKVVKEKLEVREDQDGTSQTLTVKDGVLVTDFGVDLPVIG